MSENGFDGIAPEVTLPLAATRDIPRFDDCYVPMAHYVAVDAWGHLMLEVCAELRRHGVSEYEVAEYRRAALTGEGGPYAETPRWVRVTKERSAA